MALSGVGGHSVHGHEGPEGNVHRSMVVDRFGLLILQLLFIWGMPFSVAVHLGLLAGLLQVSYAAWMSGGILSPRVAWMTVIPLVPFYAVSRRAGFGWLVMVLTVEVLTPLS